MPERWVRRRSGLIWEVDVHEEYYSKRALSPLSGYLAIRASDFAHPREVLSDPELDPTDKRAILAAWASDASAVESRPEFRWLSGTPGPVALSHILNALRALDKQTEHESAILSSIARSGQWQNA
jgi:hypothetical protein